MPSDKTNQSPASPSGVMPLWAGLITVSVAIAASVWYPVNVLTEELRSKHIPGRGDPLGFGQKPRDCFDILTSGVTGSGQYTVYPGGLRRGIPVICDMTTDGGGWLVFQQRKDGTVDFTRDWSAYQFGFGEKDGEFWLGNEALHLITSQASYELRVELEDYEDERRHAVYRLFHVGSRDTAFRLSVGGYSGDAGDSLSSHNGAMFSTIDRDNDMSEGSCATAYKSGWWYTNCLDACLNGRYLAGPHESIADGINWVTWKGLNYSLKISRMMLRPL